MPRSESNRPLVGPAVLTLVGGAFVVVGILLVRAVLGSPFETPGERHLVMRTVVTAGVGVAIGVVLIYTAVDRRYWDD